MSILNVLANNICFADDIVLLEQGAPAPFKGLLFTPEKSNAMYEEFEILKYKITKLEKINSLYVENEVLYEKKVNSLLEQNTQLSETLYKVESKKEIDKLIWFGLGFLSVGLGVYATKTISGN